MTDINEIIGRAMRVDAWALHHSPSGTWSYVGPYSKDDFVRPGSGYRAEALTRVEDIGTAVVKALGEAGYVVVPREPTDAMIDAGVAARQNLYAAMEASGQSTRAMLVANHPAGTIYQAMIDGFNRSAEEAWRAMQTQSR